MATLRHDLPYDVYCAVLHLMVPANEGVEISDEDAEKVAPHVFRVEKAPATRATVKRGSKTAEISRKPAMETR